MVSLKSVFEILYPPAAGPGGPPRLLNTACYYPFDSWWDHSVFTRRREIDLRRYPTLRPQSSDYRLLQDVEHLDCFVLFPAFFAGHFLDEAIGFEVVDDLVGGTA